MKVAYIYCFFDVHEGNASAIDWFSQILVLVSIEVWEWHVDWKSFLKCPRASAVVNSCIDLPFRFVPNSYAVKPWVITFVLHLDYWKKESDILKALSISYASFTPFHFQRWKNLLPSLLLASPILELWSSVV